MAFISPIRSIQRSSGTVTVGNTVQSVPMTFTDWTKVVCSVEKVVWQWNANNDNAEFPNARPTSNSAVEVSISDIAANAAVISFVAVEYY